ncbi:MAG: hypothetical protein QOG85_1100 [Gaiellaceae bacterium]|jgi:hypothetical protein|nr:hypothetical protein [Gaiellaceae bacterium]
MQERFIGAITWGYLWRATWPLCELVITDDEVIVRPRRFVRFVCPGARYGISGLSYAQKGAWGIQFVSTHEPQSIPIMFGSLPGDTPKIARLLAARGIEFRDRKGRPLVPTAG